MASNEYEISALCLGFKAVVGLDEIGTGSLCGDALVGGVIFPADIDYKTLLPGLNDSKKKTEKQREVLYDLIKKYAISYDTEIISMEEIDSLNIYWAKFAAWKRLIQRIKPTPDYLLIDGNHKIKDISIEQLALVKGDGLSISIAAASIIAKVDRDRYMIEIAKEVHPDYNWAVNKGYGTSEHKEAIKKHGKTKYHRASFSC